MKFGIPVTILVLVILGIYWQWLLPGPRVATDFSQISTNILESHFSLPQTWSTDGTEGLGEYTVFTLWSWQFNFIYAFFAKLGFSFSLLERLLITVPFLLIGSISIWKILSKFNLSDYAKIIGTFFYLSNTYILLVIDGGQLTISLAYALFPVCFLALEKAIYGNYKKSIVLSLVVFLMGSFDIRFIYVFAILAIVRFLYEFLFLNLRDRLDWITRWFRLGFISAPMILGLNFFWLYIIIKVPIPATFYSYLTQTSFEKIISLGHAFFLLSPHWYKNVFGNVTELRWEFIGIPILVFLAPILKSKNRQVGFWLTIALFSIFLTKGTSQPLSGVYPWLYSNLPGFSLFRDSSKFFFLVCLAYSILIGFSVDELMRRIRNSRLRIILMILLISYLVFIIRPAWLGKMTGTFTPPPLQDEYSHLNLSIMSDKEQSNIFWIPTISPLTILNPTHPALEALRLAFKRPFTQANLGNYEKFNYLREAPYMGELFDVFNIGYLVYPPIDSRRENIKADNASYYNIFLNQISNLTWLSKVKDSSIPLFKVKKVEDKIFISSNIWWVIGSDSIYTESTKSAGLSLSNNSLIFEEEEKGLGKKIDEVPQANILLNKKSMLDLAASFINSNDLIFPANNLSHEPDSTHWWKRETAEFSGWKDFLKNKYGINNQDFDLGGGWAVAEGNLSLKVESSKFTAGQILMARVLDSTRSGTLSFYQNENNIGEINTKAKGDNVRWFEVGVLRDKNPLIIKTKGEINVINAIASVYPNDLKFYKNKADSFKGRIIDFEDKAISNNKAKVVYQQISPTEFNVVVNGLTKPSMLEFAQNYDTRWKLSGISPLPTFSLINGYYLEKDGVYDLYFEPQKYVIPGMMVFAIILLLCLVLLLV